MEKVVFILETELNINSSNTFHEATSEELRGRDSSASCLRQYKQNMRKIPLIKFSKGHPRFHHFRVILFIQHLSECLILRVTVSYCTSGTWQTVCQVPESNGSDCTWISQPSTLLVTEQHISLSNKQIRLHKIQKSTKSNEIKLVLFDLSLHISCGKLTQNVNDYFR